MFADGTIVVLYHRERWSAYCAIDTPSLLVEFLFSWPLSTSVAAIRVGTTVCGRLIDIFSRVVLPFYTKSRFEFRSQIRIKSSPQKVTTINKFKHHPRVMFDKQLPKKSKLYFLEAFRNTGLSCYIIPARNITALSARKIIKI